MATSVERNPPIDRATLAASVRSGFFHETFSNQLVLRPSDSDYAFSVFAQ
ncbi:MAG: hypothetical protein H0X31_05355 [Nostocaceae cyanobacterium]|nr:hypothetical protein [Nostocaceae cyanobacterium]